ncbi:thiamine diphosphate-binding protein [Aspergillus venezuelensis]
MRCTTCNQESTPNLLDAPIDLARYLFNRLYQLGIRTVHGVPSDYNLAALDYIPLAGLQLASNTNELNAAYAADGYARVKGLSALVTAFGTGELSSLNGTAGAFAEKVPVVVIVGTPSTMAQTKGLNVHHSLGNGDLRGFANLYKGFTCAQTNLCNAATAPAEIDRVLRACLLNSQPVYIEVPTDMIKARVSLLPLGVGLNLRPQSNFPTHEAFIIREMTRLFDNAQKPLIIVDGLTSRSNLASEADQFIQTTGWPTFVTPFGKSCADEGHPNFHGVLTGTTMQEGPVRKYMNSTDLVVRFGPIDSDANTAGFSTVPADIKRIDIFRNTIRLTGFDLQPRNVKSLLKKLLHDLNEPSRQYSMILYPQPYPDLPRPQEKLQELAHCSRDAHMKQALFWPEMSKFLREGDVIITETGSPFLGGSSVVLPPNTKLINSALWMASGYALPAAHGASLAQRDQNKSSSTPGSTETKDPGTGRTILITGDSAFQRSASALSSIFQSRANIIIFLLNNRGHATNRHIHPSNANAAYHSITNWNYLDAPGFFGAPAFDPSYPVVGRRVDVWGELVDLLNGEDEDDGMLRGRGVVLIEVVLGREDLSGFVPGGLGVAFGGEKESEGDNFI